MGESSESSAREREVRRYFWACVQIAGVTFAACVLGLVVILRSPWNATIPMLWAMACTACGSIIGFVLVAPRRGSIARQDAAIAHGSIDRLQDWIRQAAAPRHGGGEELGNGGRFHWPGS